MKKYFCDVCGAEVARALRVEPKANNEAAMVCGLEDLCSSCEKMSRSLNVSALVLAELQRSAAKDETALAPASAPPSSGPTGRAAKEKRAVWKAIECFRQEHGPGAISALSDLTKADESVIWDMIARKRVPMASWRAVGNALGVSESDTGKKNRPVSGAACQG